MTPRELLAAARPRVDLVDVTQLPHHRIHAQWNDDFGPTQVVRNLSRNEDDRCLLAFARDSWHVPAAAVIRIGSKVQRRAISELSVSIDTRDSFDRIVGVGTVGVERCEWSHYVHGADLTALYDAGIEISWAVARCVYAAMRAPLVELHATGWIHGALRSTRARLSLVGQPIRLVDYRGVRRVHDWGYGARAELGAIAEAICDLTKHPDPLVDELLRDPAPGSLDVLADLVAERGDPIDYLLADRLSIAGDTALVVSKQLAAALPHTATPDELAELWDDVRKLEPLVTRA